MKLQNPFPIEVRNLYLWWWECFLCGENGQRSGGLEIHHILGRVSDCAFNSSCLCKGCHAHIGHSSEEQQKIFLKTMQFLHKQDYKPTNEDLEFYARYKNELNSHALFTWLSDRVIRKDPKQEE